MLEVTDELHALMLGPAGILTGPPVRPKGLLTHVLESVAEEDWRGVIITAYLHDQSPRAIYKFGTIAINFPTDKG